MINEALVQEIADQRIARASKLWPKAVEALRAHIVHVDTVDRDAIRQAIAENPEHWIDPYHFFWGMHIRNWLRSQGFGEEPFGVQNLDNIYVPLVEEAVK